VLFFAVRGDIHTVELDAPVPTLLAALEGAAGLTLDEWTAAS
jgi:hypothetical protein